MTALAVVQRVLGRALERAEVEALLPRGARPLSVACLAGRVTLYALADPAAPPEARRFLLLRAQDEVLRDQGAVPGEARYVGTYVTQSELFALAGHVFEVTA